MTKEEICLLQPDEWAEYKQIRLEALRNDPTAFGKSYEEEVEMSDEDWRKKLAKAQEKKDSLLLFIKIDGIVVGMMGMHMESLLKYQHIANITSVYITPEHRGKGLGKKLLHELLLATGKIQQVKKVTLGVNCEQAAAISLYEAFGFNRVGILHKEMYIDGVFYDELLMEKIL